MGSYTIASINTSVGWGNYVQNNSVIGIMLPYIYGSYCEVTLTNTSFSLLNYIAKCVAASIIYTMFPLFLIIDCIIIYFAHGPKPDTETLFTFSQFLFTMEQFICMLSTFLVSLITCY